MARIYMISSTDEKNINFTLKMKDAIMAAMRGKTVKVMDSDWQDLSISYSVKIGDNIVNQNGVSLPSGTFKSSAQGDQKWSDPMPASAPAIHPKKSST